MPVELLACAPADVIATLSRAVQRAKGPDRLAPVTVVVPTNVSGVMARRSLGRGAGILGVDMVTLNRLAELLAGPGLAHAQRQPISNPLLELTIRRVLDEAPGSFATVAHHPATVVALRELHQELRLAGEGAADRLAISPRGREAVRVSRAVTRMLQRRWYDEADLVQGATRRLRTERIAGLERLVLHLPAPFDPLSASFVRQLAADRSITVVLAFTGDDAADHEQFRLLAQLDIGAPITTPEPVADAAQAASSRPLRIVSTTDADDEVRVAVRTVIDAARGTLTGRPVPFERIALLWPSQRPYARLVAHHLTTDGIAWNGPGGAALHERIAPRLLLDLLDVDRRGLERRGLFELLADIPVRGPGGEPVPTAEWERVSRRAGVSRDEDWLPRLGALTEHPRWGAAAHGLLEFIVELRTALGHPHATRPWSEWVAWCDEQLTRWLGPGAISRFSDSEYRAWEALVRILEGIRSLDAVAEPVTRSRFRTVLENELADANVREGRIGTGVTIGSLASAGGLVIDVAVVLGAVEGLLPPAPRSDPLLSAADRQRAGLSSPDERAHRLHHEFAAVISSAQTVITLPRGDLRTTTAHQPTRWIESPAPTTDIDSSMHGVTQLEFPPSERERRLRDRLRTRARSGTLSPTDPIVDADVATRRALTLAAARQRDHLTEFDGDLTSVGPYPLAAAAPDPSAPRPVSPTQIQLWASCPHAYFVRYLLGVLPVDEPDSNLSINALDRGLVQHDVVDALHRDVLDGSLPQPTETGWTDTHRAALLEHFDRQCDQALRSGRTGRPATWASERQRMRGDLLEWFRRDGEIIRAHGATIIASEHRFPDDELGSGVALALTDGRHLAMKGSIDRLDRWRDGRLVVTDHKTGKSDAFRKLSEADPTLAGTVFQLPTYAAAALAISGGPLGHRPPLRAEYSMFERGRYQRIGIDFDADVWSRVAADLTDIVTGIEAGWFPPTPPAPGFRFSTECVFCEPDELGTTDAHARWTAKRNDPRLARWFGTASDDPVGPSDD